MEQNDVNNFIDGLVDFLSTVFGGIASAVDTIPPIALGWIFIILGILWLFRKVRHG